MYVIYSLKIMCIRKHLFTEKSYKEKWLLVASEKFAPSFSEDASFCPAKKGRTWKQKMNNKSISRVTNTVHCGQILSLVAVLS